MGDLISRDSVIEILAAMQGRCDTKAALVQNSKIWQQIKDLPNAQSEFDSGLYVDGFDDGYKQGKIDAQSEIIRCKDCKHSEHWYGDKNRCFLWSEIGIGVFKDGFCSYAERRPDEQT